MTVTLLRARLIQLQVASIGSPRPNAGEGLGVRGTEVHRLFRETKSWTAEGRANGAVLRQRANLMR